MEQRELHPSEARCSRSLSWLVWSPRLGTWPGPRRHGLLLPLGLWQRPLLHTHLPGGRVGRWTRELPHRHLSLHLANLHRPLLICNDRRPQQSSTYSGLSRRQCCYLSQRGRGKSSGKKKPDIGLTWKAAVTLRLSCCFSGTNKITVTHAPQAKLKAFQLPS